MTEDEVRDFFEKLRSQRQEQPPQKATELRGGCGAICELYREWIEYRMK